MQFDNLINSCLKCKKPLCKTKCPSDIDIPLIVNELQNGNIDNALDLILEKHSIPFICGPLCDHNKQCAAGCIKHLDLMKNIETILGDYFLNNNKYFTVLENKKDVNVCIIGGGVAGITCAYQLLRKGFNVTIFDKENNLGGIVKNYLPNFRYDNSKIDKFIKNLLRMGLKIEYNKTFGENLFIEDLNEFKYIVLALGTTKYVSVLPKDEHVKSAFDILYAYQNNQNLNLFDNKNILVLGGGNVAYDVARCLKRLNANVKIVYRRDLKNSPASFKEIERAINEGIIIEELKSPIDLVYQNNQFIGVKFEKMELIDTGECRKSFKGLNEFEIINCDYVVEALGSRCDYLYLKKIKPEFFNDSNYIDDDYYLNENRIFVCGDYLTGAATFSSASHSGVLTSKIIIDKEEC